MWFKVHDFVLIYLIQKEMTGDFRNFRATNNG